jgi:16S rRNA processing protein RimM
VSPFDCCIFACKILEMAFTKEELHVLGYFTKLHGYKGELTATFEAVSQDDYTDLESIFLEVKGQLIPYFIESIEHKTNTSVKIKLEGIDSEEAARAFVKSTIYIEQDLVSERDVEQQELRRIEGYAVIDMTYGPIGTLTRIEDNKLNPLMIIQYEDHEILLPLHPDFIEKLDHKRKMVHIQAPEGLIDFYTGDEGGDEEE